MKMTKDEVKEMLRYNNIEVIKPDKSPMSFNVTTEHIRKLNSIAQKFKCNRSAALRLLLDGYVFKDEE